MMKLPLEMRIRAVSPEVQDLFIHSKVRQNLCRFGIVTLWTGKKAAMACGFRGNAPIAKLQALKSQVEAAITAKVSERWRELESELSKLAGFAGVRKATKFGRTGRMGLVAPKYRNPDNPSETWAGRGLKPRWLAAAIKEGKKIEDFAIAAPGAKVAKSGKKTRKAKKAAKK
jgi:DNA-binding protein H-NS